MRPIVTLFALAAIGTALAGCQFGGPSGVFQHTNVPPPPSMTGEVKSAPTPVASSASAPPAKRVQAPDAAEAPAASSEPAIQPVMTGSGMGAGFRF
ncbi:hypothetical protein [Microvirga pudoricolor]|uniref:hypothetical protein n=1 Tax=Microvirga pudoricolor TaxID=2778729 RepID=UPI00194F5EC6|nr:hypothetical protein [Microvirga pudoricolor]MBM6595656.1 hypothetical protein [Microvirga pudoricolor]